MDEKTSIVSFRIDKELKNLLESESYIKQITLNQLLNKIVKKHVKWERFAEEIGLVFLSKPVFRNLLSKIEDRDLQLLASTYCRGTLKDATMFQKGKIDFPSILETIDIWLENSHIPFRRFDTSKYVIQHDLGKKYSLYLFTAISALLSEVGYGTKRDNFSEQTLDFAIVKPN